MRKSQVWCTIMSNIITYSWEEGHFTVSKWLMWNLRKVNKSNEWRCLWAKLKKKWQEECQPSEGCIVNSKFMILRLTISILLFWVQKKYIFIQLSTASLLSSRTKYSHSYKNISLQEYILAAAWSFWLFATVLCLFLTSSKTRLLKC